MILFCLTKCDICDNLDIVDVITILLTFITKNAFKEYYLRSKNIIIFYLNIYNKMYRGYHLKPFDYYQDTPVTIDGHYRIEIIVSTMTGQTIRFLTEPEKGEETYGDIKKVLVNLLKPFKILRQLVLVDFEGTTPTFNPADPYAPIPDIRKLPTTKILPEKPIKLELLVNEIEWTREERTFKDSVKSTGYAHKNDVKLYPDAFLWALQEEKSNGEKLNKIRIQNVDMSFVFKAVRDNPNIEELEFQYVVGRYNVHQPDDLRIPFVKKLTLFGSINFDTVMNIVEENPNIKDLTISIGDYLTTSEQMADLFRLIRRNYIVRFQVISNNVTYRMEDFSTLLVHQNTSLRSVLLGSGVIDNNFRVIIEDGDVNRLDETLKDNQVLKDIDMRNHTIISSIQIIESLKRQSFDHIKVSENKFTLKV